MTNLNHIGGDNEKRRARSSLLETSVDMDVGNGEEPDEINDEEACENILSVILQFMIGPVLGSDVFITHLDINN